MGDWAARRGIPYTSFGDLTTRSEVEKLVEVEIGEANGLLARVEQVKAFRLFDKELHQDDGELTATQKVRRQAVMSIHSGLISAIYGGEGRR